MRGGIGDLTIIKRVNILMRRGIGGKARMWAKAPGWQMQNEIGRNPQVRDLVEQERDVRNIVSRLESALGVMEDLAREVEKAKSEYREYVVAHEAREAQYIKEHGGFVPTRDFGKERGSLIRKGPKDSEYAREQASLARSEEGHKQIIDGRVVVVTGKKKIEEEEEKVQKTVADIRELLKRLPVALAARARKSDSELKKTSRVIRELENAISKGVEVAKRVEGTYREEVVDGGKKSSGVRPLSVFVKNKLQS